MNARITLAVLVLITVPCLAAEEEEPLGPADFIIAAAAVAPSVVFVEYELRFDKGEARGYGWRGGAENLIAQERPLEVDGFLLDPTTVMTPDIMLHPRFIRNIKVRFGDQRVEATPLAYTIDYGCYLLKLAEPLQGAVPFTFNADAEPPYLEAMYNIEQEGWRVTVSPFSPPVTIVGNGEPFMEGHGYSVITDKYGKAVGLSMGARLPADGSWKGSPLKWPTISADEMTKLLADLKGRVDAGLLRVKLNFRSPKAQDPYSRYSSRYDDEGSATERNVVGILIDPRKIVVLAYLKPKVTARLERITVYPKEGEAVSAKFMHTLKDYGCFTAELDRALPGDLETSTESIAGFHAKLLLSAEVTVKGEKLVAYLGHVRVTHYKIRWRRNVYPQIPGPEEDIFLFDLEGRVVAAPVAHREKAAVEERWSSSKALLTPASYIHKALADLPNNTDPDNVPLREEEENRLAWLGVEMQALNRDLAQVNNVSDLTRNGETGALVSYVYPDSPAAKAGIEVGDILLRLHVEGQPKPLEVAVEESRFGGRAFRWDQLDEIPEQYYDRIPKPWPPAENSLTRKLTDIGFGKKYKVEFVHDAKVATVDLEIAQSPAHYDSTPRYKAEALGLTVRGLTYEVRRYFQKKPEDPGVIVSKIEPGSKGSVAGIKPYEIITHVNDQPIMNVKDFEELCKGKADLRLSVKRMTRGRVVPIKMTERVKESAEE